MAVAVSQGMSHRIWIVVLSASIAGVTACTTASRSADLASRVLWDEGSPRDAGAFERALYGAENLLVRAVAAAAEGSTDRAARIAARSALEAEHAASLATTAAERARAEVLSSDIGELARAWQPYTPETDGTRSAGLSASNPSY
jgi:hypothetical protein